jgi:putative superfamily III holin-X
MEYAPDARSMGELFSDLTREVGTLIRSELALARTELSDKAAHVGRHAAVIVGGAVVACGGVFAIIAGLVLLAIRAGLPAWSAALVVGAAVIAAGGLIATRGLSSLRREDLTPRQTISTLKETATWKG